MAYLSRQAKERIRKNEKNILMTTVGGSILGLILMCIAVGCSRWIILRMPEPLYVNATQNYFLSSYSGLWKYCIKTIEVASPQKMAKPKPQVTCYAHPMFPSKEEIENNPRTDETSLHYSRAEGAFAVITIFIMSIAHIFSIYSFTEPRYMFKRLAGFLYFLSAANCFVTIEMVISSHLYEEKYLPAAFPKDAVMRYGVCFYMTCLALALYIAASIIFIIYSHKRKDDRALTTEEAIENRPMKIRR